MKRISNEEMKNVKGGSINWGLMTAIGAAASFFIGVIDGWMHPKRCNS